MEEAPREGRWMCCLVPACFSFAPAPSFLKKGASGKKQFDKSGRPDDAHSAIRINVEHAAIVGHQGVRTGGHSDRQKLVIGGSLALASMRELFLSHPRKSLLQ
jgi:hypothetical protein